MKVIITENAAENLWQIYLYHSDYTLDYAEQFQFELTEFIFSNLSKHPQMGTLYNPALDVYRVVYLGRYNIYYVLRDALFIIFILDGRMSLNIELASPDVDLPTIT